MEPPSTPSDPQPVDLVAGRVVRGGAGPCYGVRTDDGKLYAVHSTSAGELEVGTTVLVKLGPARPRWTAVPASRYERCGSTSWPDV